MGVIDYLTCGGCQTEFPLSNIVKFMQHKKNAACALPDERNGPSNSGNESSNYSCYTCPEKFEAAVSLLQHAQYQHKQNIFRDSMNNQTRADNNTSRTNHFLPTNSDSKVPHIEDRNTREEEDVDLNKSAENVQTSSNSTVDNDVDQESEMMEPLDKCCTSVIPKKRKRHIETKHRSSFFKNARPKRPVPPPKMAPSDINIYLDPADLHAASLSREAGDNTQNSGSEGDSQGLLLEPGGLVTIPFSNSRGDNNYFGISYSGAPTPTDSNSITPDETRPPSPFNNNNVRKPHTHEATQQSPSITNENIPDTSASSRKKYPTSKPFKCDHCGDSFNQRIHLKKHLSKHTGVKPYKCGQCDYATVERSHLKVHIRIHTGEKPFKCTHCEYATAQNSTLKIHLKRHHGGTLTLCAHCGTRCEKFLPEKKQLLPNKQEQPVTSLSPCILPSHSPPISAAPHPSSGTTSHTTISHSLPRSTLLSKTSGENMRSEDVP